MAKLIFDDTQEQHELPDGAEIAEICENAGVPFACTEGVCGTCITGLISGQADHRDMILSDDEHQSEITVCCSRAKSPRLVLDL